MHYTDGAIARAVLDASKHLLQALAASGHLQRLVRKEDTFRQVMLPGYNTAYFRSNRSEKGLLLSELAYMAMAIDGIIVAIIAMYMHILYSVVNGCLSHSCKHAFNPRCLLLLAC